VNPLTPILQHHPIILLDGALATELEQRGCDLRDPLWSAKVLLEAPDLIRQVHLDYFLAGADGAITASYQATVAGFMRRGLSSIEAIALIQRSVRLAMEARDAFWADSTLHAGRPRPFVAASVGPYGAFLADGSEYRGDYGLSEANLIEFHRPRLAALLAAGADILAVKRCPVWRRRRPWCDCWPSFPTPAPGSASAPATARIPATANGWPIAPPGSTPIRKSSPVGINCTAPRYLPALIRTIRFATGKPIVVYPNSGETYRADLGRWEGTATCVEFATEAERWYASGARLIGGCCRTTPDHIAELAGWIRCLPSPCSTAFAPPNSL
jgi:homocysteine S-methyltransferase